MNNKEIKNSKDKKEMKKRNINMKDNISKNDKENSDINKLLLDKKKKRNINRKNIENIDKNLIDNPDNNNPNNTYILPPPIPKLKKQTHNLSQSDKIKNKNNGSSVPPSTTFPLNDSQKEKKINHTTKIKLQNPVREANSVHVIDGSKEIIFKKDRIENLNTNKENRDGKMLRKKPIQIKCPTTNESIIIQPDEIYDENIPETSELIYINDPNKNTEEETLIDIPPPNDLDVLYIEVGNKFRKVNSNNTDNYKTNEKEIPKISDSHKILSYMKNADHLMKYFFLGITMLFGGVCLLSLIIFPWSTPKASCEKDTTSELYNFLIYYTPHASMIAFITNFMVTFSIIGILDKFVISITASKLPLKEYTKSFSRKLILIFLALVSFPCFITTTLIKYIDINITSSDRYYKLPSVTNTAVVPYEKISWEISKKDLMPIQKWQTERLLKDIKWWVILNLIRDVTGVLMCLLVLIEMLLERSAKKKYRKLERNILLSKILNYENINNSKNNKYENNDSSMSSNFNDRNLNNNRSIDNFTISDPSINRIPLNQINK